MTALTPHEAPEIQGMHSWFDGEDDYGRPNWMLYATVQREGAETASWGAQVVVTKMPATYTEVHPAGRYMVTSWMVGRLFGNEWRRAAVSDWPDRASAMEFAEFLVADQQRKTGGA